MSFIPSFIQFIQYSVVPQRFAYEGADEEQDAESEYFNKPEFTFQQRVAEPKPQQTGNLFASLQQQHQQIRQQPQPQPQPQANQNFALYYQQVIF